MANAPILKKRRIEEDQQVNSVDQESPMKVVLALCGSFNPPTILHLRLFGMRFMYMFTLHMYMYVYPFS